MTLFVTAILCVLGCAVFFFCKRWMPSWARWGSIKTSECRISVWLTVKLLQEIGLACILLLRHPRLQALPERTGKAHDDVFHRAQSAVAAFSS